MEGIKNFFAWSLSFALFFLLASTTWAQIDVGNYTISGGAEIGALPGNVKGDRGGYERYRDLPESVIVPELQFMLGGKKEDFYLNFDASKVGRDDQNYNLRFGRYGLFDVQFEWDQIPHIFNDQNAMTPFSRSNDGATQTLSSRPTATGPLSGGLPTFIGSDVSKWLGANAHPIDLSLLNEIARLKLRYTPGPEWTFTGSYWSNHSDGRRALGILNGYSSSTMNLSELAEPIDYQTHNIELGGEYTGKGWSIGLKYNASFFHNSASTLVWDNPIHNLLGGQCVDSATFTATTGVGPCQGRLDLYPSNQAHTVTLTGTASLPLKTSFLGTLSYGLRRQDDPFLPFTINRCYTSNPALVGTLDATKCVTSTGVAAPLLAMPTITKGSLGGDMRPLLVNLTLVNNSLVDRLKLRAYYRFYDLSNQNHNVTEPKGFVGNDIAPVVTPEENEIVGYSKNDVGMEAGYDFTRWLTGKFNYTYERMHRNMFASPETINSNNNTIGPTLDIKPNSWILLRALYRHSWRDDPGYDTNAQMFFMAKRNENKTSLFTDISPWDTLSFHGGFEFTSDTYPQAQFGIQDSHNYSPSVGFLYMPLEWVKLFGDYNWDRNNWSLATNNGLTATVPGTSSKGRDTVNTFSLGGDMELIKNLLGFRLQYSFSQALSQINSTGGGIGTAAAQDYPPMSSHWNELLARLEYKISKNLALRLGYYFNQFKGQDYGVDIMKPWMGDVIDPGASAAQLASQGRSIFLGDAFKGNYSAHVGFISLAFKF